MTNLKSTDDNAITTRDNFTMSNRAISVILIAYCSHKRSIYLATRRDSFDSQDISSRPENFMFVIDEDRAGLTAASALSLPQIFT